MARLKDPVDHAEIQSPDAALGGLPHSHHRIWLATLFAAGLLARLYFAGFLFLDPDESLHYWVSLQPSLDAAYRATLSTAHPPLFIIFLYYWRLLGHSELVLRLPGVLAGLTFAWIVYKWVALFVNRATAELALPLLLFTPSLIWLSAEIRQYWLLLLFIGLALYCFERAVAEQSITWIVAFTLALDISLASHYSSLLFALTMGIYALLRLGSVRASRSLLLACALGQLSALAEVGIFFQTHISLLKKSGLPQEIAGTWLRKSIFHPGDHVILFLLRNTVRFFRYLFGNGIVGALGLAAFLLALFFVFKKSGRMVTSSAPGKERFATATASGALALQSALQHKRIGLLLLLPFAVAAGAALQGLYPYGGTRHDIYLAPFAILGVGIALSSWNPTRRWILTGIILLLLALANIFPSPAGPFIKPKDQSKSLMSRAIRELRESPPGTIVFTDYEGGLLLSYYLCGHPAVQPVPPYQPFTRTSCGQLNVVAEAPSGSAIGQQWTFHAQDIAQKTREVAALYGLRSGAELLVFRAGWSAGSDVEMTKALQSAGCSVPAHFGENIMLCRTKPE